MIKEIVIASPCNGRSNPVKNGGSRYKSKKGLKLDCFVMPRHDLVNDDA